MTRDAERSQEALQIEALLLSRAYLYELFHKLLGGTPDAEVLKALLGQMTSDALEEFAGASDELVAFGGFLAVLHADDADDLLDRARDEYTRVLVGPLALPASPYESPYTGAHDMALFQQNTLEVRAAYGEWGLQAKRLQAVPDDHVSIMCAFAAELSQRAIDALLRGDGAELASILRSQGAFVGGHLTNWLGVYATSVRNSKAGAQAVLYPQLLEALFAFAKADFEFLVESAYWADGESSGLRPRPAALELASAYAALKTLEAQRPFGIQDNELVPVS